CGECFPALTKENKVLQSALANGTYRGELPEQFRESRPDLGRGKNMCDTIAHVACLFQSSDLCEMNVVSTAFVLPRTPADVNGVLSIVFVGAGKSEPDQLRYGSYKHYQHHVM
ncbi:hypothetical protein M405DRAFT_913936, partial [Rhizopogon salebrosus TDB-379]